MKKRFKDINHPSSSPPSPTVSLSAENGLVPGAKPTLGDVNKSHGAVSPAATGAVRRPSSTDAEKSVVESLMLMSHKMGS